MDSSTPRTDEFIASRPTWPWGGNETQVLMAAVFARDAEWAQFARQLESALDLATHKALSRNEPPVPVGPEHPREAKKSAPPPKKPASRKKK